jgi:predicted ATPase
MPSVLAISNYRSLRNLIVPLQRLVVTHAATLIAALSEQQGYHSIVLEKEFGETRIAGMNQMNTPTWHWPAR